jgi:hypothetical protein
VNGVAADPVGPIQDYTWVTWSVRLPDNGSTVTVANVNCNYTFVSGGSDTPRGFEIVKR